MMMQNIVGVILAGGRSTRMGEDKSFLELDGLTLIEHGIKRAQPQVEQLLISTNVQNDRYQSLQLPLIADTTGDSAGPLAGLLAAMDYLTKKPVKVSHLASFPVDSPFYPQDLVKRLALALQSRQAHIAIPRVGGRSHWAFGLWSLRLADDLHRHLVKKGRRKVQDWIQDHKYCLVDFDDAGSEAFFNINTPDDLATAIARLS